VSKGPRGAAHPPGSATGTPAPGTGPTKVSQRCEGASRSSSTGDTRIGEAVSAEEGAPATPGARSNTDTRIAEGGRAEQGGGPPRHDSAEPTAPQRGCEAARRSSKDGDTRIAEGGRAEQGGGPPGPTTCGARSDRAQATVELALLLPVVAVLIAALLQVAVVARDAVLVTHAAREGARAAAVDAAPDAARRAALAATGLDPDRIEVQVTGRGEPGSQVRVEVRYRLEGWLPLLGPILTDRTFAAHAAMRVE
jgi:hypothetical protein